MPSPQAVVYALAALAAALAVLAVTAVVSTGYGRTKPVVDAAAVQTRRLAETSKNPENLIFMLADGTGPIVVTAARQFKAWADDPLYKQPSDRNGRRMGSTDPAKYSGPWLNEHLTLDTILKGAVQTRSLNSHITDSAAGITAYSCAGLTLNGWIAKMPKDFTIEPDPQTGWKEEQGVACKTLLEKSKEKGMVTGVVVTSRFTHATPAGFASHTVDRDDENRIAWQMIEKIQPNIIMGGGARHLKPKGVEGSAREDAWDGIAAAKKHGYTVIEGAENFWPWVKENGRGEGNEWRPTTACQKILYMEAGSHKKYWIDQAPAGEGEKPPGLAEMMRVAIQVLRSCNKGYFLLMEASRIDHALHDNDVATAIHEVLEYDRAVAETILPLAKQDTRPTLVVGSADHDTGGLSIGMSEIAAYPKEAATSYAWYPEVLKGQKGSISEGVLKSFQAQLVEGETMEEKVNKMIAAVKEQVPLLADRGVASVFEDSTSKAQHDPERWDDRYDFEEMKEALANFQATSPCEPSELCRRGASEQKQVDSRKFSDDGAHRIAIARKIANKANLALQTGGHSATDVNLYCWTSSGSKSCKELGITGSMRNYEVGRKMGEAIQVSQPGYTPLEWEDNPADFPAAAPREIARFKNWYEVDTEAMPII